MAKTGGPSPSDREHFDVALRALDVVMGKLDVFTDEEALLLIQFTDNTIAFIVSRLSGGGVHEPRRLEIGGPSPPLQLAA